MMDKKQILAMCDHTILSQCATWGDVKCVLDDAVKFGTASACIPACYVAAAKKYVGDRLKICTVIGFPNGYSTTGAKLYECTAALEDGADEIDTVINIGWLKDKRYEDISRELKLLKQMCKDKILKVIIEACLLTEDEKIKMCELVSESGADFIKTSTGFSTGGATPDDIALFKAHIAPNVKIKAAGGISSFEDAELLISLGADRLGTSRLVKAVDSCQ